MIIILNDVATVIGWCILGPFLASFVMAGMPGAEKLHWRIGTLTDYRWQAICSTIHLIVDVPNDKQIEQGVAATEPLARRIAEIKALVKS